MTASFAQHICSKEQNPTKLARVASQCLSPFLSPLPRIFSVPLTPPPPKRRIPWKSSIGSNHLKGQTTPPSNPSWSRASSRPASFARPAVRKEKKVKKNIKSVSGSSVQEAEKRAKREERRRKEVASFPFSPLFSSLLRKKRRVEKGKAYLHEVLLNHVIPVG